MALLSQTAVAAVGALTFAVGVVLANRSAVARGFFGRQNTGGAFWLPCNSQSGERF